MLRLRRDVAMTACDDRFVQLTLSAGLMALLCFGVAVAAAIDVSSAMAAVFAALAVVFAMSAVAMMFAARRAWVRVADAVQSPQLWAVIEVWCHRFGTHDRHSRTYRFDRSSSVGPLSMLSRVDVERFRQARSSWCHSPDAFSDLVFNVADVATIHYPAGAPMLPFRGVRCRDSDRELVESGMFAIFGCFAGCAEMADLWKHTVCETDRPAATADDSPADRMALLGVSSSRAHTSLLAVERALQVRRLFADCSAGVSPIAARLARDQRYALSPSEVFEIAELVVAEPTTTHTTTDHTTTSFCPAATRGDGVTVVGSVSVAGTSPLAV